MKFIRKTLLVIALLGLMVGIVSTGDTILLLSGKEVSFTGKIDDFSEKALISGNIDFVYGPFAVLEETQKQYGVTVSKKETEFYIVSNIENGEAFVVFSTSNEQIKRQLSDASDKWIDWFSTDDDSDPPEISIDFKGKLAKQPTEEDYDTYYLEAVDDLSYVGVEENEYASMRIIEGEISKSSIYLCFGGYAVAVLCAVIFIVALVSARKNRQV